MAEQSEKLQKILSRAGLGSRRVLEEIINEGRVSVNGKVAKLGDRAVSTDKIRVDGRIIKITQVKDVVSRVFMYNKPEGEVCTRKDPQGRPNVYERLPPIPNGRLIGVGRLDVNTTGLLLFTNDGDLAHRLMHPSNEIPREYSVRVFGEVTDDMIKMMQAGIMIEDNLCKFDSVRFVGGEGINRWYNVILHEGRNREVRHLFEHFELKVSRLIRVRFGDIQLDRNLPRGGWKELGIDDVNYLRTLVDLPRVNPQLVKNTPDDDNKREKTASEIRRAVKRHNERRKSGLGSFHGSSHDDALKPFSSDRRGRRSNFNKTDGGKNTGGFGSRGGNFGRGGRRGNAPRSR